MILAILPVIPLIGALFLLFKRGRFINIPLITSAVVLVLGVCGLKSVLKDYHYTIQCIFQGLMHRISMLILSLLFLC